MGLFEGAKCTCDCCGSQFNKSDAMNLLYVNVQYANMQDDAVLCGDCVNRLKLLYSVAHTKDEANRASVSNDTIEKRIGKYKNDRQEFVKILGSINNESLHMVIKDLIYDADNAVSEYQAYLSGDNSAADTPKPVNHSFFGEPVFSIEGNRGRHLDVYEDFAVITVSVTAGSVLSGNATDGQKVIFYKDCIGIQFKMPGVMIGFLQLETASSSTNNLKSNYFNENTFTFQHDTQTVMKAYQYIFEKVKERK